MQKGSVHPVPITLVIVDDQAMVRQGFSALLAAQPDFSVLGDAADGVEAVELCARVSPDVVLMDVRMPVLNGIAATDRQAQAAAIVRWNERRAAIDAGAGPKAAAA